MPEYLLFLALILVIAIILQKKFHLSIYSSRKHMILFNAINLGLATIWDQFAIARGHWSFGEQYLLGIKIGFMPIEEFLFVPIVAYFGLVLYKIIQEYS